MAKGLLEFETLSGEEVKALMRGENIVRRDDNDGSKGPAGSAVPTAGRSQAARGAGCRRYGSSAGHLIRLGLIPARKSKTQKQPPDALRGLFRFW